MKFMAMLKKKQIYAALACGLLLTIGADYSAAEAGIVIVGHNDRSGLAEGDNNQYIVGNAHSQVGYSDYEGIASGANYTITGGSWGGKRFYGGHKDADILENNYIGVTDGTFSGEICGAFLNTGATGITRNNTVKITGGTFSGRMSVTGGNAYYGASLNNTVIMSGVTSFGGDERSSITGGWSGENTASGNQVILSNSTISDALIVGGNAATISGKAYGNRVELVNCTYNITSFSSIYDYAIIGGYAKSWAGKGASSVYDNTVVLGGGNSLQADVYLSTLLATGSIDPNYKASEGSNGTLEIRGTNKILRYTDYGLVSRDEYYYCGNVYANNGTVKFYLTSDYNYNGTELDNVMLGVERTANFNGSQVQLYVDDINELQKKGELTLIKAGTIEHDGTTVSVAAPLLDIQIQHNDFADNKLTIVGNTLKAKGNEDSKSPVETQAASVSFLNLGADMIAGSSFESAAQASAAADNASSFAPFATMGASNIRINSGSHVDLNGRNINLGLAKKLDNEKGQLLFGPVIEYGRADYDSYLDNGTQGEGTSTFTGAGFMAKKTNPNGFYYEGSVRAGQVKNEYKGRLKDVSGAGYKTKAAYYGVHAGVGKVVSVSKQDSVDCYGKIFYNHQNGDQAKLNVIGYTYDFKSVDSLRSRLGMKYNHQINQESTVYLGLAWQHEFDGKARASFHTEKLTFETPSPSVKGDTGILELGWKSKSSNGRLETGLGVTGSVGKQKGISFNGSLQWNF